MQFYASASASVCCYTYRISCCVSSVANAFNLPLMHAWWGRSTNVGLHVNTATPGSRGAVIGCTLPSVTKTQGNAPRAGGASGVSMPIPPPRCAHRCVISSSPSQFHALSGTATRFALLHYCSIEICSFLPNNLALQLFFKNPNPKLLGYQAPLATSSPQAPSQHLHQILVYASTVTSTSASCHCCRPSSTAVPLVRPLGPN